MSGGRAVPDSEYPDNLPERESPNLYDADTAEWIGYATRAQVEASSAAANKDGGAGIFRIDPTTGEPSEHGRRVYTDDWIEPERSQDMSHHRASCALCGFTSEAQATRTEAQAVIPLARSRRARRTAVTPPRAGSQRGGDVTDHIASLVEAFHMVYDVRDEADSDSETFLRAYEATRAIERLIVHLGGPGQDRTDGQGRWTSAGPPLPSVRSTNSEVADNADSVKPPTLRQGDAVVIDGRTYALDSVGTQRAELRRPTTEP